MNTEFRSWEHISIDVPDSLIRAYHSDESSILGQLAEGLLAYKLFTQIHVKRIDKLKDYFQGYHLHKNSHGSVSFFHWMEKRA
jgi:hypothetical protein